MPAQHCRQHGGITKEGVVEQLPLQLASPKAAAWLPTALLPVGVPAPTTAHACLCGQVSPPVDPNLDHLATAGAPDDDAQSTQWGDQHSGCKGIGGKVCQLPHHH